MKKPKFIPEFRDIPAERKKMPELTLEERAGNFKEVELGLEEEMVLAEAARCLSCRRCIGCGLCLAECDQEAVVYDEAAEDLSIEADAIIFTSDGEIYNPDRKQELGYCDSANVITSLEFERLVSPTGPFGGYLLKPFDGDMPRKIAFIQCVGSREEAIGANYCSTVCCSRTLSQARRAKEMLGEVEVTVYHRGLRPIGKRSELDLQEVKDADWIEFVEAAVSDVKGDAESGSVTVAYSAPDKEEQAEFDLVVLAVGLQSKKDFRRYARASGIKPNKFGFIARHIGDLIAEQAGVTFAGSITGPRAAEDAVADAIAAVSRSFGASRGVTAESRTASQGKPLVYACEYGLELAGKEKSVLDGLKLEGCKVDGIHPFLCYKDGRSEIAQKVGSASSLVVIGCHRGSHEDLFERLFGLPPGSVVILGRDELDGALKDAVTSALERPGEAAGKARAGGEPATVAVVGGGTSGLAATSELLRRGAKVFVIEKSAEIGKSLIDAAIDAGADVEGAEGLICSIKENPEAGILLSTRVMSVERSNGGFSIKVSGHQGEETLEAEAVLLATGAESYAAEEYRYGQSDFILNQADFRTKVTKGEISWKKIVMIQCVGARDADHPYCSRFCCKQALSNALLYRTNNPEAEITILHKGMRVSGFDEELLTDAVEQGIEFVETTDRPAIKSGQSPGVTATSTEGERLNIECDLVVLSLAHFHGKAQENLSEMTGVPLDELKFLVSKHTLSNPFATPVEGIFACGFSRRPVVAEDAFVEGIGAAGAICRALGI
jgi:heterodisulfide reductase subunit A-like polyferredoxin